MAGKQLELAGAHTSLTFYDQKQSDPGIAEKAV